MARLYKRDKTYYVDYTTVDGERIRQSLKTSDRALARRFLAEEVPRLQRLPIIAHRGGEAPRRLMDEYLASVERDLAPTTALRYSQALKHFEGYLLSRRIRRLADLTRRDVERYKTWRSEQNAKPRTINLELKSIRTCLNWCVEMGELEGHPFHKIQFIKDGRKTYHYLTDEEAAALIAVAEGEVQDVVLLGLYAGLRRGEILALDPKRDIDVQRGMLYIRTTKSKEPRVVPMHSELVPLCQRLTKRSPLWSFVDERTLWWQVKKAMRRCGIEATLHDLRHTFCRNLARSGASERYIMELAGHQDIQTTQVYTRDALSPEHLRMAMNRLPAIAIPEARNPDN